MDLTKISKLPAGEQLPHLLNAIVDYRCKTDALAQGETELPWVTATVTAIDADAQSLFVEGRWVFLKNIEWRPNQGQHLRRVVSKYTHDERTDGRNTAERTKAEYRKIIPGNVAGAAGPLEFAKA